MIDSVLQALNEIDFHKTEVEPELIKEFSSEDQFMELAVELFKEISKITSVALCTYSVDDEHGVREWWTRDEAILGGLMVRLCKLQFAFLEQICQHKAEVAFLLHRSLIETIINLKFLMEKSDSALFLEYVEYSLRAEKKLQNLIDANILDRGFEEPQEKRMKVSIANSFEISSVLKDKVDENSRGSWGGGIQKRAKEAGLDLAYNTNFSMGNHSIHGNWQDLLSFHLEYREGRFFPNFYWVKPSPQLLFYPALLSGEVSAMYLLKIVSACEDVDKILGIIGDVQERVLIVSKLYQLFLEKEYCLEN